MAKKPIKQAQIANVVKPPRPLHITLLVWVVTPLVCFLFRETLLLFSCGMIPTFVAYLVDPSKKKQITKTVGYANLTGCFIVAFGMWAGDNTVDKALDLLSDEENWLIMFGTASVGWIVYFVMRPLVNTYLSITFDVRRKRLRDTATKLVEEWGEEVKKKAPEISIDMLAEDEKSIKDDMDRASGKIVTEKVEK